MIRSLVFSYTLLSLTLGIFSLANGQITTKGVIDLDKIEPVS